MKVRPKENYHLLGTDVRLDKSKTYPATWATNQPDWEKDGKIFVNEILLNRGEYKFVAQDLPAEVLPSWMSRDGDTLTISDRD